MSERLPSPNPVLYSYRRCPYAMRARMALVSAGLCCELREISLRAKPESLLAASPKATVPVLVLADGQVLEQSLDIMLHALRQHDPDGWLQPEAGSLDDMLALIARNDGFFKQALDRCKYPERHAPEELALARTQAADWCTQLEVQLSDTGYLFGRHPSLADMALRPFIRQFARIDDDWWSRQPWPHLQAWLQHWLDSALFAQIMDKYATWVPGTPGPLLAAELGPAQA